MIDYTQFAFIFDMDGTLVDNMTYHTEAWQIMLDENGIKADAREFLVNTAGKTNREIIPQIFPDASEKRISELAQRKEELYRELFLPHRKAIAGATEFLDSCVDLGIRLAVATAAPVANMEFILDGLDLRKYFGAITTAADVKNGKPDPEVFIISAEKLVVPATRCFVFEDAFNGFEAAYRAKMKAVGIATVNSVSEILGLPSVVEAYPDFTSLEPQTLINRHNTPPLISEAAN
jgi:beta-phosphoglucomutase family hydrolase